MARGRRGPPDLKTTLGSLLRTTLEQVGAVKDAVEQQTRGRGGLIDQALIQRRRKDAMAKLGEIVHRLARSGELGELALDPKIGMCLEEIDELDDQSEEEEDWQEQDAMSRARGPEAISSASYRPRAPASSGESEYRVWRPTHPSKAGLHTGSPSQAAPAREFDAALEDAAPEHVPASEARGRSGRLPRKSAQRSGSAIQFIQESVRPEDPDSDEDLESYMHDDDVPLKD